jgi:hypothetical protein
MGLRSRSRQRLIDAVILTGKPQLCCKCSVQLNVNNTTLDHSMPRVFLKLLYPGWNEAVFGEKCYFRDRSKAGNNNLRFMCSECNQILGMVSDLLMKFEYDGLSAEQRLELYRTVEEVFDEQQLYRNMPSSPYVMVARVLRHVTDEIYGGFF